MHKNVIILRNSSARYRAELHDFDVKPKYIRLKVKCPVPLPRTISIVSGLYKGYKSISVTRLSSYFYELKVTLCVK